MRHDPFGDSDARQAIEAALQQACQFGPGCPSRLADAIRYAVLAPGKRLRPRLVCAAAAVSRQATIASDQSVAHQFASDRSSGASPVSSPTWDDLADDWVRPVMAAACAVEMVHAYSLIHDDLPAMDDDDLRRGRPTVHIEFDAATAILAGDALQPVAFRTLCDGIDDPLRLGRCVAVLAHAAGPECLVGGQSDDLAAEQNPDAHPRSVEFLESIHRRKTGALFEAAIELGCITADADDSVRRALAEYARSLGLAFQVMDDYLDATSNDETLGKRAGKDGGRGKLTYVEQWGVDATLQKAVALVEKANQALNRIDAPTDELRQIADFVASRSH